MLSIYRFSKWFYFIVLQSPLFFLTWPLHRSKYFSNSFIYKNNPSNFPFSRNFKRSSGYGTVGDHIFWQYCLYMMSSLLIYHYFKKWKHYASLSKAYYLFYFSFLEEMIVLHGTCTFSRNYNTQFLTIAAVP